MGSSLSHLLTKAKQPSLFVRRFGLDDIKLVPIGRIKMLGQNKVDRQWASKTTEIGDAYNMAVAIMRGDI